MKAVRLYICLSLASAGGVAAQADWPQWRGPTRDGISTETGLLTPWPEGGPRLVWTARDLGGGYSGPSVAGGVIYGMSYRGEDEVVWALTVADGKQVWSTVTGPADRSIGYGEGSRGTPTVDGQRLYTLGAGGRLSCLETGTGKIVWQQDLVKDFGGRMMSGWGFSESPLVDGDQVVCTPGGDKGTLLALDKATGQPRWQSAEITDRAAYSSIMVAQIHGLKQYVQLTDQHVFGVFPADGRVLWKAARRGRTAVIPTPIVHNDWVYVTSGYGVGCNLFRITREGTAFKAEEIYANKVMANHHGGVILRDGHLYGYSEGKGWTCQNLETGQEVWAERRALGKGSIGYADGHFYLRHESGDGTVVLIQATTAGYREVGRFNQPDRSGKNSWPHPVIAGGRLYLRDQDILLCYDVQAR